MFPWMMPGANVGSQLSLLSLMQGGGQGGYAYGSNPYTDPNYWSKASASRRPGQSNWDLFMRGMLPQNMWPAQWKDDDRSDQAGNRNQPDIGNVMGPPQGAPGGP